MQDTREGDHRETARTNSRTLLCGPPDRSRGGIPAQPGPVIICPDPDWAPFEYRDQNDDYCGIAADLIALVFARLGATYSILWTEDWRESLAAAKEGRAHVVPFLNESGERDTWLTFTEPIFVDPNVFVTRLEYPYIESSDQLERQTIAIPEGTSVAKKLQERHPHVVLHTTSSELEAFLLVRDGHAQMSLRSLVVSAYTIGVGDFPELKIAGQMPELTNYLRMGVVHAAAPLLHILNKAIASITPKEQVDIVQRHVNRRLAEAKHSAAAAMMLTVTSLTSATWHHNYQLQRNNEAHRLLLDTMETQVWYLKDSRTYGAVNQAHAQFLGGDKASFEDRQLGSVFPEATAAEQVAKNAQVFADGQCLKSSDWFTNTAGEHRLLQVTRVAHIGVQGEVEYVVCSAEDITDRHRMEHQLLLEREFFRTTLLSVSDAVISADARGRVVVMNKTAAQLTGLTPETAVGRPL